MDLAVLVGALLLVPWGRSALSLDRPLVRKSRHRGSRPRNGVHIVVNAVLNLSLLFPLLFPRAWQL